MKAFTTFRSNAPKEKKKNLVTNESISVSQSQNIPFLKSNKEGLQIEVPHDILDQQLITENYQKQINQLKEELSNLKNQNEHLFQLIKQGRNEIIQIKNNMAKILNNKYDNNNNIIQETKKYFQVDDIHQSQVSPLIELSDKRIATGSWDGLICISKIDYEKKEHQLQVKVEAHEGKVKSLCELTRKRFVSCGDDKLLKIWDYSSPKKLKLIHTLQGHTGRVFKVINLTKDRIASCSFDDHSVRIWQAEKPFNVVHVFQQQKFALSIIQLTKRYEIICINCASKIGSLNFFDLNPPFNRRGSIDGIMTNTPNGIVELSNGDIAVSKGCYPIPCIYIVDPVRYLKICEIIDSVYIPADGALCVWGENSFVYAYLQHFCEISYDDGNYKIVYKNQSDQQDLYGANSLIHVVERGFLLVAKSGGFNVITYS